MHYLLVEEMAPEVTANASRGKSWRFLDSEIKKRILTALLYIFSFGPLLAGCFRK